MAGPAIETQIEGLGNSDRFGCPPAIPSDHVEERRAPFVVGEEAVEIAADGTVSPAAHLGTRIQEQRLSAACAAALPVVNLIA